MLAQSIQESPQSAHVVVLGNEKSGSGKSTTALHIAVALLKAGQRVATLDLELPIHFRIARGETGSVEANEAREFADFSKAISAIEHTHDVLVLDRAAQRPTPAALGKRPPPRRRAAARAEWYSFMDQPLQVHDLIA